jgi:tetratricopeptide (TPR) repeat protein
MAIALVPVLLALPACKSPGEQAATLAAQAEAQAAAGNLVAAREGISQAIALRDSVPQYYQLRGAIAMQTGDTIGAYRAFQRVLELDATNTTALAYVANLSMQVGQIAEGDEAADRLLTLDPNAIPALQVKGMIALSRNKYDEAEKVADRILTISRSDEAGTIIKSRAMAKKGQVEDALKLLDTAMAAAQESPALLTNKLNLYRNLRQPEQMNAMLTRLVALDKSSTAVRLDQINLLYKLGKVDEARTAAMNLLTLGSGSPEDYRTLQRLWADYDKTPIPAGPAGSSSGWKDPLAILLTARYLITQGDLKTADALVSSAPARARPLLASLKARLLAASGRTNEARQQIDAQLKTDTHDVDALLLRAVMAADQRQMDVAVEAAQLAQANDPLNAETYVILARIFRAQGADQRARQIFESGIKNLPQNFTVLENYTQFLHESGDKGRAISVARAFARGTPSSVRAWSILAVQCQRAGDRSCLEGALAGRKNAENAYLVDDPPGTPPNRGLFGRI